jgi:hypothetical protein
MSKWKDVWDMLVRKLKINRGQSGFRAHYAPATATLVLTTFVPDAIATNVSFADIVVTPAARPLVITELAPAVASSSAQAIVPTTRALVITEFVPTITRPVRATPTTKALVVTRNVPTITNSSLTVVVPTTKALTMTRYAPAIGNPKRATPTTKALTMTRYAPSVGAPKVLVPATKVVTVTRFAPTVTAPQNRLAVPAKRSLVITRRVPTVTVSTITSDFPPSGTLTKPVPPTPPAIPAYLTPYVDPTWGTTITRVSNVNFQRNIYSRTAGWNSNQSMILLSGYNSAPAAIISGQAPYTFMHNLPFLVGMGQWSNTNPNKIYGTWVEENFLRSQTYNGGSSWTLNVEHTFTGYSSISLGDSEGGLSDDDDTVALLGRTTGGAQHLISFDIGSKTIIATRTLPMRPDNAFVSRSGQYILVYWSTGDGTGITQGLQQYDRNLNYIRQLTSHARHGDPARLADGTEVWAQVDFGAEYYRMDNGAHQYLFSGLQPYPHNTAFTLGHCSGRATSRNGWVYLSVFNYPNTGSGQLLYGRDQIVAANLDNPGEVQVFAWSHHRNEGESAENYPTAPFATPSRDGTKVLFGSEWGDTAPYGAVYAYVAEQL